jgi:hypothetical protein
MHRMHYLNQSRYMGVMSEQNVWGKYRAFKINIIMCSDSLNPLNTKRQRKERGYTVN